MTTNGIVEVGKSGRLDIKAASCRFVGQADESGDKVSSFLSLVGDVGMLRNIQTQTSSWSKIAQTSENSVIMYLQDSTTLATNVSLTVLTDAPSNTDAIETNSSKYLYNEGDIVTLKISADSWPASIADMTISCGEWRGTYISSDAEARSAEFRSLQKHASLSETPLTNGKWKWNIEGSTDQLTVEEAIIEKTFADGFVKVRQDTMPSSSAKIRAAAPANIECTTSTSLTGAVEEIRILKVDGVNYPENGRITFNDGRSILFKNIIIEESEVVLSLEYEAVFEITNSDTSATITSLSNSLIERVFWNVVKTSTKDIQSSSRLDVLHVLHPYASSSSNLVCFPGDTLDLRGLVIEKENVESESMERFVVADPVQFTVSSISMFGKDGTTASRVHATLESQDAQAFVFEIDPLTGMYAESPSKVETLQVDASTFAISNQSGWTSKNESTRVTVNASAVTAGTGQMPFYAGKDGFNKYDGLYGNPAKYFAGIGDSPAVDDRVAILSKDIPDEKMWYDYLARAAIGYDVRETSSALGVQPKLLDRPENLAEEVSGSIRRDSQYGLTTRILCSGNVDAVDGNSSEYTLSVNFDDETQRILAEKSTSLTLVTDANSKAKKMELEKTMTIASVSKFDCMILDVNEDGNVTVEHNNTTFPSSGIIEYRDFAFNYSRLELTEKQARLACAKNLMTDSPSSEGQGPFNRDKLLTRLSGQNYYDFNSDTINVNPDEDYIMAYYFRKTSGDEVMSVSTIFNTGERRHGCNINIGKDDDDWHVFYFHMQKSETSHTQVTTLPIGY